VYSSMPLDGETAHHGGDVCVMSVSLANKREFFVPTGMHLGVKLLTA